MKIFADMKWRELVSLNIGYSPQYRCQYCGPLVQLSPAGCGMLMIGFCQYIGVTAPPSTTTSHHIADLI